MIKSLYSGVTGLKTHNQRMDVIGNNIANVNTTAYKAGTVTFKDVYYQTKQSASGGNFTAGGVNPKQVGYGVQLGTISKVMTQSGLTYSDSVFDCALEGAGFFQVMDSMGNIYYTRLGRFDVDSFGNLVDPNGNIVLGVSGDPTGIPASSQRINLFIPPIEDSASYSIKEYLGHEIIFEAGGFGPGGNINISIIPSDVPFANMSGSTLNVFMDLNKDYEGILAVNYIPGPPVAGGIGPRPIAGQVPPAGAVYPPALGIAAAPATVTPAQAASWERMLTDRISQMFSDDLKDAIRLGGVNVDPVIYNPEDPNAGISITFNSIPSATPLVPNPTAAQQAKNTLRVSDSVELNFLMDKAGAAGNRYEINVDNKNSNGAVTARWTENVLTISLPADGNVTLAQIQEQIDLVTGVTRNAAGEVTDATIPDRSIRVTGTNAGADMLMTAMVNTAPATPPAGFRDFENYMNGRTLLVAMANGANSFFSSAFESLTTVRMEGGFFFTPQTPDDCIIEIGRDGVIYAMHPQHEMLLLGRIDIVDFVNPNGLNQVGTSYFTQSRNSGEPRVKIPSDETNTFVIAGALEMSNVDLSQEFSDMIITQRGFQANSRIITVSDTMLEELINLKR
ncbi:MAG: flagellar hook-basal body complex protein [Oscillospiraceae bacterium]|nr:flagellar hook-basal body complex protein [Oscillospiraceae bacterium]